MLAYSFWHLVYDSFIMDINMYVDKVFKTIKEMMGLKWSKKLLVFILVLAMSIVGIPFISNAQALPNEVHLTILGTSDTHSNLYGFSYENGKESTNNGMARVSTYVNQVRAQNPNTILLDNGDTYQGTILADAVYNKKPDVMHPVSKVYNYMNYDALTLGNHEFNFGVDFVEKIVNELDFPVLGANVEYKDGKELAKPYIIIEKQGVKIGILGLTNPNAPRWDGEKVDAFEFKSVPEVGKEYARILKEDEKVDVLIVTAHVGMIPEFDEETGADGAAKLLEDVPYIDVLLLGHYHILDAETIGNTLVGAPRNSGRDVAQFDLNLVLENGKYVIKSKEVKTVDMENITPDPAIRALIQEEHQATIDFINGEGAEGEEGNGGGVFGVAAIDFQPVNEINGIPEGKLRDTAVIDLIAKVQLDISGADVTAVALFQDDSDLKAGNINYGNLFNIYKFDNTLYTLDVTGKELKAYMEWSALHYNTWKPGDISISFDENVPGYLYDMFEGVDYKIDLSKPAGERIKDVYFKGEPLEDDQVLTLAVNNYRYSSGLKANKLVEASKKWESPKAIRDYLAEYIQKEGTISPTISNNWEIVGVDLDNPLRDEIIALVNSEKLAIPYNKSLNIQDLQEMGIIKDGKVIPPSEEVDQELEHSEGPVKPTVPETPVDTGTDSKTTTYIVKNGDYLIKIAKMYGVNYRDIAKENNIKNANLIFPNQKLIITLP